MRSDLFRAPCATLSIESRRPREASGLARWALAGGCVRSGRSALRLRSCGMRARLWLAWVWGMRSDSCRASRAKRGCLGRWMVRARLRLASARVCVRSGRSACGSAPGGAQTHPGRSRASNLLENERICIPKNRTASKNPHKPKAIKHRGRSTVRQSRRL